MCTRTNACQHEAARTIGTTPPSHRPLQVRQKPKSTRAAAQARAKTNPTSSGRGLLYKINKTSRTNRRKNVDFQQHLPPVARAPREVRAAGRGRRKDKRSLSVSTPTPSPTSNSHGGSCDTTKGPVIGKRTSRGVERAAKERFISTYCRFVHSTALRLCTAAYWRARGAGSNGQATGGAGASRARGAAGESSRECGRGSGVRDLGDRLTEERFNACVAALQHNSLLSRKRRGSEVA
ncbi:uncharacterized protein M421DRAFT_273816 [Didymella exigua CBS 183.55]|uniref:Uncharacterized protein n=1 Tax=Didymella exigua CBS 183.55 TaxID=1150837 RepID=A0A6A5RBT5_9PLEO|nr:uncharacterized protein M421DRAFT_273816 [Didymella exigua CBS 183.55]KAF1924658.1 hypothetical protein M421DRAFT_273816 [Didymella exigua CBS 183.55]